MERPQTANETKLIYHVDDEDTPYLVRLPIPLDDVTLLDFKNIISIPKTNLKYWFKAPDEDGVLECVKVEVNDDSAKLPVFKGRIVAYVVSGDGSHASEGSASQITEVSGRNHRNHRRHDRLMGDRGNSQSPLSHGMSSRMSESCGDSTSCTETESMISSRHHRRHRRDYEQSSAMTSELDTTSFLDSDDDDDTVSRLSATTDETSVSRVITGRRRRRHRMPALSRASSVSSDTDSSMSLNIIQVTLHLDTVNFLGISIVGQSNQSGDGGIYVGSIMNGGAVALDGRIQPGDMILQVNDVNFENMSNDEAVRVLRDAVQKPGPIKLVVVKCWNETKNFTIQHSEPIRPIDPGAWVAHTEAARASDGYPLRPPTVSTHHMDSSSSIISSLIDLDRPSVLDGALTVEMDMLSITKMMATIDSGLDIKDRCWLKITIPNAFLGSDVVDWLYSHVQGFQDRREAKKYAAQMLKQQFIKHTVSKNSFSEACYYVFGEMSSLLMI